MQLTTDQKHTVLRAVDTLFDGLYGQDNSATEIVKLATDFHRALPAAHDSPVADLRYVLMTVNSQAKNHRMHPAAHEVIVREIASIIANRLEDSQS